MSVRGVKVIESEGPRVRVGSPPGEGARPQILGLNGLRALSVLAVLAYHGGWGWAKGGFLGVEVFFVISGYLITGLLLKDHAAHGRIRLGAFWKKRLLRLAPSQAVLLGAVLAAGALWLGPRASQFRGALGASLACVENWRQIRAHDAYFADQGLPLLKHLWSLSVEMQFYALWPPLLAGLLALARGARRPVALGTGLLALGSVLLMATLADPGHASSARAMDSLNRVYLGTDTRAAGLLVGALLALLLPSAEPKAAGRAWGVGALAALGLVLAACAGCGFEAASLYRGGLLGLDLLAAGIIAALVLPGTRLVKSILGWKGLEWIGSRSYGLYLWHWPVFKLVAPGRAGWAWGLARWSLAFALAALAYRFVEAPARSEAFWTRLREELRGGARPLRRWGLGSLGVALGIGAVLGGLSLARRAPYVDEVQESLRVNAAALDSLLPPAPERRVPQVPVPRPAPVRPEVPPLEGLSVTAIGDSVMKGAANALKDLGEARLGAGHFAISAEESRPFARAQEVARTYQQQHRLGEVVVIHLGTNNSSISEGQFQKLMGLLADRRLVLFVTAKSGKAEACEAVNAALTRMASGYSNARVFDWKAAAEAHPDYFYADETHLRPSGARFYAEALLAEIGRAPRAPETAHYAALPPGGAGPTTN